MGINVDIDNWDEYFECEHAYENSKHKVSGLFALAVGALLFPKYLKKYKESIRRLTEISNRQQNIALQQQAHYLDVTHPQMIKAIESALSMPLPSKEVDCSEFSGKSEKLLAKAKDWTVQMNRRYMVCNDYGCDNELDVIAAEAAVDTGYARFQHNIRRWERRVQLKRKLVQKASAATHRTPAGINELFNNAGQIYSQIFNNAQTNLSGAVGNIGYGLGTLGI